MQITDVKTQVLPHVLPTPLDEPCAHRQKAPAGAPGV